MTLAGAEPAPPRSRPTTMTGSLRARALFTWMTRPVTTVMVAMVSAVVTMVGMAAGPAAAAGPSVRIVPAPAAAGTRVTAFGQGFCGTGCPAVKVAIGGNTVASADTADNGSFVAKFVVRVAPGQYTVTATQQDPAGTRTASTGLVVLPADTRPTSSSRTHTATSTASTLPHRTKKATRPPSSIPPNSTTSSIVTTPGPSSVAAAPVSDNSAGSGGGTPGWVWLLLGPFLVAAGGSGAWLLRRRGTH